MRAVAAAHDGDFRSRGGDLRAGELRAMAESGTEEGAEAWDFGEERLPGVSGCHDDVFRVEDACSAGALDGGGPEVCGGVVGCGEDCAGGPDVEFHCFGVGVEPVGEFVFGGVDLGVLVWGFFLGGGFHTGQ